MSAYHYSGWGYGNPENPNEYECWPVSDSRVAEWTPGEIPGHGSLLVWSEYGVSRCYTVAQLQKNREAEMCIQMHPTYADNRLRMLGVDPNDPSSRFD